eukprot:5318014-Amphidinium_carterae.1
MDNLNIIDDIMDNADGWSFKKIPESVYSDTEVTLQQTHTLTQQQKLPLKQAHRGTMGAFGRQQRHLAQEDDFSTTAKDKLLPISNGPSS